MRFDRVRFRHALYVAFLSTICAVPPLATDMYLAAMPTIAKQWGISTGMVGLSLVLFFVSFSLGLLVCGPVSDKYGRRPVLLGGLAVFTISSALCGLAANVEQLIAFRVIQGLGAAGPSCMCMAICRDRYEGETRKRVLAYIGVVLPLAPMVAPSIGSLLLEVASWRFIFGFQTVLALLTLVVSLRYRETAKERLNVPLSALFGRYLYLIRNRRYLMANKSMGLVGGSFFAFLGFSPIVYINLFGLSEKTFSLLFGLNAVMSILGAFLCSRLIRFFSDTSLLTVCLIGCLTGGVGVALWGEMNYLWFTLPVYLITFFIGMSRPLSNHLILDQVDHDIGSASSGIVFYQFMVGAVCMSIVTQPWSHPILVYAALTILLPGCTLAIWPFLLKRIAIENPASGTS